MSNFQWNLLNNFFRARNVEFPSRLSHPTARVPMCWAQGKIGQLASDIPVKYRSSVGIFEQADSTPWSMSGTWCANYFCMFTGITAM